MKFAFLAVSAAALLVAAPAFAGGSPASTSVTVNGTVGPQCGVGHQSGGGTRSINSPVTVPVVDVNGQLDTTTTTPIAFDNLWCNAANTLTMDVTALKLQNAPAFDASSFTAAVDMNVGSDGTHAVLPTYFGGVTDLQSNGATDGVKTVPIGAFETGTQIYSEALLTLKMPSAAHSPGIRPLAGSYTGTVTITATPN